MHTNTRVQNHRYALADHASGAPAAKLIKAMISEYSRGELDVKVTMQIGNVISVGSNCAAAVATVNSALSSFLDGTFGECELTTPTTTATTSLTTTPIHARFKCTQHNNLYIEKDTVCGAHAAFLNKLLAKCYQGAAKDAPEVKCAHVANQYVSLCVYAARCN